MFWLFFFFGRQRAYGVHWTGIRSEPQLQPMLQLSMPDPLTHHAGLGVNLHTGCRDCWSHCTRVGTPKNCGFVLFFPAAPRHMEFPGQGSDLSYSYQILNAHAGPGMERAYQYSRDTTNPVAPQRKLRKYPISIYIYSSFFLDWWRFNKLKKIPPFPSLKMMLF